jgi:tetratricopeptide (TPR) repeat protein
MSDNQEIEIVQQLLELGKAKEAKLAFQQIAPENTIKYLLLKGKIEQKFQNWGEAINSFNKVLELDPENSVAQNNLHLIKNILNFWNPDMFNP